MREVYRNKCEDLMERFQCTGSVGEDEEGAYLLIEVSGPDKQTAQDRLVRISDHLKAYRTHERGVEAEDSRYVARLTARLRDDGAPPTR